MANSAVVNPDVGSSWLLPGVYISLDLSGSGAGLNNAKKRLLCMGYKTSSGSAPTDTPLQVLSQSDANTYFGSGSMLARMYAAAISQVGAGVIDTFCIPIAEPSGGTAGSGTLVYFLGTASAAGVFDIYICGYRISVPVANGDTATTIAANAVTAINLNTDIPVTAIAGGTDNVTLQAKHAAVSGKDVPVMVNQTGASGMIAARAVLNVSGASATASGTIAITCGSKTLTNTFATSAVATSILTTFIAQVNGTDFPLAATAQNTTTCYMKCKNDRPTNFCSNSITTSGVTISFSTGTAPAGTPSLSNALTVLAAQGEFQVWCVGFNDATSLGTISTHIELYANGMNQKGQTVIYGSWQALATAGAIPAATTPLLTASPRYAQLWFPDSGQQSYEWAARAAAYRVAQDYKAKNYDGMKFVTRGSVPMLAPHMNDYLTPADQNSAIYTYAMAPMRVNRSTNEIELVYGRTTSLDNDLRLWDWSFIDTFDYIRYDLRLFLRQRFASKSLRPNSATVKTQNTTTLIAIQGAIYERLLAYDDADLFDNAEALKSAIVVAQDQAVPQRVDINIPIRPPLPLHQLAGVASKV